MWGDEFRVCVDPFVFQWMANVTQTAG